MCHIKWWGENKLKSGENRGAEGGKEPRGWTAWHVRHFLFPFSTRSLPPHRLFNNFPKQRGWQLCLFSCPDRIINSCRSVPPRAICPNLFIFWCSESDKIVPFARDKYLSIWKSSFVGQVNWTKQPELWVKCVKANVKWYDSRQLYETEEVKVKKTTGSPPEKSLRKWKIKWKWNQGRKLQKEGGNCECQSK